MLRGKSLSVFFTSIFNFLRCGHCKRLEPTYNKLAEDLSGEKGITISKVDGTQNQGLASRFGIRGIALQMKYYNLLLWIGFPSIYLVRDGEVRPYQGPRRYKAKEFNI